MRREKPHFYEFGPFRLDPSAPLLLCDEHPVALTPKALGTLVFLVEHRGRVVSREELIEAVWPDVEVEENNLSVNVSALRKALGEANGEKYIETVPRRGYRFTAPVRDVPVESIELIYTCHTRSLTLTEEVSDRDAKATRHFTGVLTSVEGEPAAVLARSSPGVINQPVIRRGRKTIRLVLSLTVCLAAAIAAYFYFRGRIEMKEGTNIPAVRSIAVLPLKAVSANGADESLSLGLADSLITRLGSSQKIVVRPLSSITKYAGTEYDALEAGREMQVDAVLDGSFQRVENRLRVNVRLLNVSDGRQIWTGTFNETESDIFQLQDAISSQAAKSLALNLNSREREAVLKRYTENVEAYQAYLRGRYLYHHQNFQAENLDKAIVEFEQALKLDPNYALAYSGLADSLARKANSSEGSARSELYEKAKTNGLKALALDDNIAETHAAIGWINRIYDWNWEVSERHLKRAIDLAPNEARFYHLYAFLLITLGRTAEAVENARKAMELDPAGTAAGAYAFALSCDRQFDKSIAEYEKILGKSPDTSVWRGLANVYLHKGQPAEAVRIFNLAPTRQQEGIGLRFVLSIAYYRLGENDKAEEILRDLEQSPQNIPENSTYFAAVYTAIGRREEAVAALQKALEIRDDRLMWIKTNSHFEPLRADPRFQEILQKLKL